MDMSRKRIINGSAAGVSVLHVPNILCSETQLFCISVPRQVRRVQLWELRTPERWPLAPASEALERLWRELKAWHKQFGIVVSCVCHLATDFHHLNSIRLSLELKSQSLVLVDRRFGHFQSLNAANARSEDAKVGNKLRNASIF